jgi:hypothetical protein
MLRGSFIPIVPLVAILAGAGFSLAQSTAVSSANYSQPFLGQGVYDLTTVYGQESAAWAEDHRAYTELNMTVIRLQREFTHSAQYKTAAQDIEDAHNALDAARRPDLATIYGDPHYQELNAKWHNVAEVLAEGGLAPRDMLQLAARKMDYGSEMRRMEAAVLNGDSAVTAARDRLVTAQKHLDDMRQTFEDNLYKNPTWAAAKQSYDNAEIAYAGAQGAVIGANVTACLAADADIRHSLYNWSFGANGIGLGYGFGYPNVIAAAYYARRY